MRFCSHCGKRIIDEARICIYCGRSVNKKDAINNNDVPSMRWMILGLLIPIAGIVLYMILFRI